jgi:DNA-binding transcriptional ArsR family regulator
MYALPAEAESEPDIWHALADPTRRSLIDRLAGGARTTSQLCEGMPMTRFGVMKHLGILERAGLVIARRRGRLRLNHLNAAPLRALHTRWASARADALVDAAIGLATDTGATDMPEGQPSPQAEIVDIALEWPVEASVQRTWQALFDRVQTWWPAAHRAVGGDAAMTFDARLGGQLREARPDGSGILWYEIIAFDPLRSVDLAGHLATRYGGPAASLLHIEIAPGAREGTSILKLTDSVFGRIGPEMRASLASGWQAIVGEGLVAHLGAGEGD